MNIIYKTLPILVASTLVAPFAQAEDKWAVTLGAGAIHTQSIFKNADNYTNPLPVISVEYGNFYFQDLELGYQIADRENYNLNISIIDDYLDGEREESQQLKDMGDVDRAFNLRLDGEYYTSLGIVAAGMQSDISDEHKGVQADVSWYLPMQFDRWTLVPTVSARWLDKKIVNHYYGVEQKYVTGNRAAYSGDNSYIAQVNFYVSYAVTKQWSVSSWATYQHFGKDIKNSTIVDDDSAASVFVGTSYSFDFE